MAHGQIVGMKDSSGDLEYFQQICRIKQDRPDFTVLIGPEHLLPEAIQAVGDGGVNGGSNVIPELFVKLYQALTERNDDSRIQQLQAGVDAFQEMYSIFENPTDQPFSLFIAGTKGALMAKKITENVSIEQPFSFTTYEVDGPEMTKLHEILAKVDTILLAN